MRRNLAILPAIFLAAAVTGTTAAASAPPGPVARHAASAPVWVTAQAHQTVSAAQAHEAHLAHIAHLAHLAALARQQTAYAPAADGDGDHDGDSSDTGGGGGGSSPTAPAAAVPATSPVSSGIYSGGSSYQQCVISRESGGSSQVMNSSGHYGLYQFDYSTWVSGGGSPSSFGNASVTEQNQVFASVYAARGTQPWSSNGC